MNPVLKYDELLARADFNRPATAILLDLIHVFLDYEIPLNKIVFYNAAPVDQRPAVPTDEDSFVRADIDPAYDYRLPGDNGFLYRRLALTLLAPRAVDGLEPVVLQEQYPFTTHSLLFQINRFYNIQLRPEDLVNEVFDDNTVEVRLKAQPGSYCWQGEAVLPVQLAIPSKARITPNGRMRITSSGAIRVAR